MKDSFKTSDGVICPYCNKEAGHSYYINVHGWKDLHECGECGKQFTIRAKVTYDIIAEKIEFKVGNSVSIKQESKHKFNKEVQEIIDRYNSFDITAIINDTTFELEYGFVIVDEDDILIKD